MQKHIVLLKSTRSGIDIYEVCLSQTPIFFRCDPQKFEHVRHFGRHFCVSLERQRFCLRQKTSSDSLPYCICLRGLVTFGDLWRRSGLGIHLPNALESRWRSLAEAKLPQIIYYILYTIYYIIYTIYTIYYILDTIYYILYTICYMLYTIGYILYTVYYILYTIYDILYTICYILYTIYYIVYSI